MTFTHGSVTLTWDECCSTQETQIPARARP
jgi:hypothetical protein